MPDCGTKARLRAASKCGSQRPAAPEWFADYLARPLTHLTVGPHGAQTLAWGEVGKQGVMLLHGYSAHAGWWAAVAPGLAETCRVAALTLTGPGEERDATGYNSAAHAVEILEACQAAELSKGPRRPLLIAHSFGGMVALGAVCRAPDAFSGLVLVDCPVTPTSNNRRLRKRHGRERFPDLASGMSKFRLLPSQPCENLFLLDHLARGSLKESREGWRWRFDPAYFDKLELDDPWVALGDVPCPVAFIYGEKSILMDKAKLAAQRQRVPPSTPFVEVANAHHHIMLDQPMALLDALRNLLARWSGVE